MYKPISYKEWLGDDEEVFEECSECYGEGTHKCKCGDEHVCCNCGGSGKINMSRLEYNRRVELDIAKVKRHLVGNKLVI